METISSYLSYIDVILWCKPLLSSTVLSRLSLNNLIASSLASIKALKLSICYWFLYISCNIYLNSLLISSYERVLTVKSIFISLCLISPSCVIYDNSYIFYKICNLSYSAYFKSSFNCRDNSFSDLNSYLKSSLTTPLISSPFWVSLWRSLTNFNYSINLLLKLAFS